MDNEDKLRADVRQAIQQIVRRGEDIEMSQLNAVLPQREYGSAEIEDILGFLAFNGISVLDDGDS